MQGGLGTAGMHPDVNERKEKSNNQKINNSMEPNIQSNDSWNRWSSSITQFASALLALVNDSSATSCPSIPASLHPLPPTHAQYQVLCSLGISLSSIYFCIMLNPINPQPPSTLCYYTHSSNDDEEAAEKTKGKKEDGELLSQTNRGGKFGRPNKVDSLGGRKEKNS